MFFSSPREAIAFFYVLVDLFCAGVMGILLYTTLSDVERTNKRLHLLTVLVTVIIYCFVDTIWILAFSNVAIPCTQLSRYLSNILTYTVMAFCAYTICRFFLSIWESVTSGVLPKKIRLIFLPFVFFILLTITTPWTGLIFNINSIGVLIKGPLYSLYMIFMFGYLIVFAIISLVFYFKTQNDFAKEQYSFAAIYTIPVLIGAHLHNKYWTLPSFAMGFTFATLIIYIFQMRDLVTIDSLTGINNRRQGERFFLEQIRRINEEPHSTIDCLYLFMMDLNRFKSINDTYGHNEGDKALIATADVLKKACSHIYRKCIMSRFGGDEFVIGVVFTPEEAHLLNEKIHDLIRQKNEEMNTPYKLSISIGYTYYKKDFKDFRTFLTHADKLMYEMKEIAHRESELENKDEE
ncbi:MAG: diguanylate cyclase [Treponema sp.]|nr:diguanylate cyclase [Treponema sp.]